MKRSKATAHHQKGPGVDSRLSEGPAAELIEFGYAVELREAGHVFPHELWNHKAHSIMLYEQGILGRRHVAKILAGLRRIETMGFDRFPMDPHKGELYYNIESYLLETNREVLVNGHAVSRAVLQSGDRLSISSCPPRGRDT